MNSRICTKCKLELTCDNFNKRKDRKSGFCSACKICSALKCKEDYYKHNFNRRISSKKVKTKICCDCKQDLPRCNFSEAKSKGREGLLMSRCKDCTKLHLNKLSDKFKTEEGKLIRKEHRLTRWAKIDSATSRVKTMKRKLKTILAFPKWANETKIKEIYKQASSSEHVDHIVPLQSKYVSGLHVESNLRVIPARENISKGNRFWPHMPNIDNELIQLAERFYND